MSQRQFKTGYFILEGLNSFSTVYYSYYLYFFMHEAFGFGNKANLALAGINGLLYMVGSFYAGRLAERHGYFTLLKLGFTISIAALVIGLFVNSAAGQTAVIAGVVLGMCCTWPTLEALISENESRKGVQHMVGIYNIVWSGTGAIAYFVGGAMLKNLGLKSLFWVPAAIQLAQLGFVFWLSRKAGAPGGQGNKVSGSSIAQEDNTEAALTRVKESKLRISVGSRTFLTMAWLANPFAYIAINTLVAVIPGVARRLELSTEAAGFCCSIWCFARLASFWWLWQWNGWHYRFRWLLAAYVALVGTFVLMLVSPNLPVLVVAQIIFGGAIGLIYYSSLYYSMDGSENMGHHSGIHEAAIGFGNFAGPAIGATSLQFFPEYANSAVVAVSTLLMFGLTGLVAIWWNGRIGLEKRKL
jgi:predicted MFS family arabinose efflux permease